MRYVHRAGARTGSGRAAAAQRDTPGAHRTGERRRPVIERAADLLATESQNYPCFIQLLGRAAWDAAEPEASAITLATASKGAVAAGREIEQFYAERYGEARGREVEGALAPLAELFAKRGGRLTERKRQLLLRDLARRESIRGDRRHLLNTLSDIWFLWETPPTGWELGIPSFADFLLAHHTDAGG